MQIPMRLCTNQNPINKSLLLKYSNDYNLMVSLFNESIETWNNAFTNAHPDMVNFDNSEYNSYIARQYQSLIDMTIPSQRVVYYIVEPDLSVTCHVRESDIWMRWEQDDSLSRTNISDLDRKEDFL